MFFTYLPLMPFLQGLGDGNIIWQINSFLFTFLGISVSKYIKEPAGSIAKYQIHYFLCRLDSGFQSSLKSASLVRDARALISLHESRVSSHHL